MNAGKRQRRIVLSDDDSDEERINKSDSRQSAVKKREPADDELAILSIHQPLKTPSMKKSLENNQRAPETLKGKRGGGTERRVSKKEKMRQEAQRELMRKRNGGLDAVLLSSDDESGDDEGCDQSEEPEDNEDEQEDDEDEDEQEEDEETEEEVVVSKPAKRAPAKDSFRTVRGFKDLLSGRGEDAEGTEGEGGIDDDDSLGGFIVGEEEQEEEEGAEDEEDEEEEAEEDSSPPAKKSSGGNKRGAGRDDKDSKKKKKKVKRSLFASDDEDAGQEEEEEEPEEDEEEGGGDLSLYHQLNREMQQSSDEDEDPMHMVRGFFRSIRPPSMLQGLPAYLRLLGRVLRDQGLRSALTREPTGKIARPFLSITRSIENVICTHRESLLASSAWQAAYLGPLTSRPFLLCCTGSGGSAERCEACGRVQGGGGRQVMRFFGPVYDGAAMWTPRWVAHLPHEVFLRDDEVAQEGSGAGEWWKGGLPQLSQQGGEDKFIVAPHCRSRSQLYHTLLHYKLRLLLCVRQEMLKRGVKATYRSDYEDEASEDEDLLSESFIRREGERLKDLLDRAAKEFGGGKYEQGGDIWAEETGLVGSVSRKPEGRTKSGGGGGGGVVRQASMLSFVKKY